ncbi:10821_t:CDS:2, partial [Cetraspora pellucida]
KLQQTSGTNSTGTACNTPTREEEFRATREVARQRNEVEVLHQQVSRKEKKRETPANEQVSMRYDVVNVLISSSSFCNSTFEEVASRNESPVLNPSVLAFPYLLKACSYP